MIANGNSQDRLAQSSRPAGLDAARPARSSAASVRGALLGQGFDAQVQMMTPRAPCMVQKKAAASGTDSAPVDNQPSDPAKPMSATPSPRQPGGPAAVASRKERVPGTIAGASARDNPNIAPGDDQPFDPTRHMAAMARSDEGAPNDNQPLDTAEHMAAMAPQGGDGRNEHDAAQPRRSPATTVHGPTEGPRPAARQDEGGPGHGAQTGPDNEGFDPSKHAAAMAQESPGTAAAKMKPELETRKELARKAYSRATSELADIESRKKWSANLPDPKGERKARIEAEKKAAEAKLKSIENNLKQIDEDLATIQDPSADAHRLNSVLVRNKNNAEVSSGQQTTDFKAKKSKVPGTVDESETQTTTTNKDGKATKTTESKSRSRGVGGWTESETRSHEEITADGKKSSQSSDTRKLGPGGFSTDRSWSKSDESANGNKQSTSGASSVQVGPGGLTSKRSDKKEETKDGKTTSVEQQRDIEINSKAATKNQTTTTTHADGSSETKKRDVGVTRGDGKIGANYSNSKTNKDVDGNESKHQTKASGALIAGDKGVGAEAEVERSYERKSASGLTTGAVGGLTPGVVCNVEKVPETTPPKYRLTVSISLGAKIGLSASQKGTSDSTGMSGNVGAGASVSGSVTMAVGKVLPEQEALAYVANLKAASAGSPAGVGKEFAVIACLVNQGREAAQRLYLGLKQGAADPVALEKMQDGDMLEAGKEGTVGGNASLGGSAGIVDVGVSGGYEVGRTEKVRVEKKDGKFEYTMTQGESEKLSGGGTVGVGIVKAGGSASHTNSSSTGYKFVLDPKDPDFAQMQYELSHCHSQADLHAFAVNWPKAVGEKTESKGTADAQGATLGVGPVEGGLNYSSSYDESVTRDAEGNVIKQTMEGTNTGGATLKVGDYKIGGSSKETATAEVDAEGNASVDVSQTDTSTDTNKFLEANIPFAGGPKNKETGALSAAAGGDKAPDTDTHHVAGIKLNNGDLDSLSMLAQNYGNWMKACPSPRLRDDWAKVRGSVVAADGNHAAIAKALARFVGKGGHGRDEVITAAMRGPGDVSGGARYEFPEGLIDQKPTYDALVAGDPVADITAMEKKSGVEAAKEHAAGIIDKLTSLYNVVRSQKASFESPAVHGEMLATIAAKKDAVLGKLRVLKGGKADEMSRAEAVDKYNVLLTNCMEHKDTESGVFTKIAQVYGDGDTSLDEQIEIAQLLKQIRDLHATWNSDYDEMASIAQTYSLGQGIYWRYKPDTARFARAQRGAPGPETAPTPETNDKRKAKLKPSVDLMAEADGKVNEQKEEQATSLAGQLPIAASRAQQAGAKLLNYIKREKKQEAQNLQSQALVYMRKANRYVADLKAKGEAATEDDWTCYGELAVEDYKAARCIYEKGLALYPPGGPKQKEEVGGMFGAVLNLTASDTDWGKL